MINIISNPLSLGCICEKPQHSAIIILVDTSGSCNQKITLNEETLPIIRWENNIMRAIITSYQCPIAVVKSDEKGTTFTNIDKGRFSLEVLSRILSFPFHYLSSRN
jgi:hypothetical protein